MVEIGHLKNVETILAYGKGRGRNSMYLTELGYNVEVYDVNFDSFLPVNVKFDCILLVYVLNVVLEPTRKEILNDIKLLSNPDTIILVEVRSDDQIQRSIKLNHHKVGRKAWKSYKDGFITPNKNTFQKGFKKNELKVLLEKEGFEIVYTYAENKDKTSLLVKLKS